MEEKRKAEMKRRPLPDTRSLSGAIIRARIFRGREEKVIIQPKGAGRWYKRSVSSLLPRDKLLAPSRYLL